MKNPTLLVSLLFLPLLSHAGETETKTRILDMQRQTETALRGQSEPAAVYRLGKALAWTVEALAESLK